MKNKYFAKIILTTSGAVIESFRKWKSLPDP